MTAKAARRYSATEIAASTTRVASIHAAALALEAEVERLLDLLGYGEAYRQAIAPHERIFGSASLDAWAAYRKAVKS